MRISDAQESLIKGLNLKNSASSEYKEYTNMRKNNRDKLSRLNKEVKEIAKKFSCIKQNLKISQNNNRGTKELMSS